MLGIDEDVVEQLIFRSPFLGIWRLLKLPSLKSAAAGMNNSTCMNHRSDDGMCPSPAGSVAWPRRLSACSEWLTLIATVVCKAVVLILSVIQCQV